MSVKIHILTVTAQTTDGDFCEVTLSGLKEWPTDPQVDALKEACGGIFSLSFERDPDRIEVHDAMKFRAERPGEEGYKDA